MCTDWSDSRVKETGKILKRRGQESGRLLGGLCVDMKITSKVAESFRKNEREPKTKIVKE